MSICETHLNPNATSATRGVRAQVLTTARRPLPTAHRPLPTPRAAFTLIELLIVLAIITVVVALGVPLFGALTGAKSVESGRNLVAATIGSARTIAVNEGKYAGVLVYVDPATERTALSLVIVADPRSGLEDADPYEKYKAWVGPQGQQDYRAAEIDANGNPTRNDHVISIAVDADATFRGSTYTGNATGNPSTNMQIFGNYRPVVRTYRCTEAHNSRDNGAQPPENGPYGSYTGSGAVPQHYQGLPNYSSSSAPGRVDSIRSPFGNRYWNGAINGTLERYSGEQVLLPKGVDVQVIVQQLSVGGGLADRYLRIGVVMFDPQGRLMSGPASKYLIEPQSTLGQYLSIAAGQPTSEFPSGLGIVLYDSGAFRDQKFATRADFTIADTQAATGVSFNFDPNSHMYTLMDEADKTAVLVPQAVRRQSEIDEEKWLDNNGLQLLINRFSGVLSSTQ